ncbi:hypothetical protein [Aeromonas schubertii]|nr:hypothetical protein [Aeromonas schubertii]
MKWTLTEIGNASQFHEYLTILVWVWMPHLSHSNRGGNTIVAMN